MNKFSLKYNGILLFIFGVQSILIQSLWSAEAPTRATVTRAKGDATVTRAGNLVSLIKNMVLEEGEVVKTGKGGLCTLKLESGSKILVFPSSEVSIRGKKEKKKKGVELNQKVGFSWMKIKKLSSDDEVFTVRTPTAVAGVRGTAFSASVSPKGKGAFCVCEGAISVESGGQERLVEQGELMNTDKKGLGVKMGDAILLKRPMGSSMSCLACHQGGSRRGKRY